MAELNQSGVKFVEIRFYHETNFSQIEKLFQIFENSKIRGIELLLNYQEGIDFDILSKKYQRICKIGLFFKSEVELQDYYNHKDDLINFSLNVGAFHNNNHCGSINVNNFDVNIFMYLDSLNFNTCLNKKISISQTGEIKNCPSMTSSFGNISDTKFSEVVINSDFTKLWKITKKLVNVCKICEFRYICTDCRVFLEDPLDNYSKPLKCGYDPITGIWDVWSNDINKVKLFNYYISKSYENQ